MSLNKGISNISPTQSGFKGLEVLSCRGNNPFAKHIHDGYVLWLNSEGAERFQVKSTNDILQPECIGIVEPGIVHANTPYDPDRRHLRSFYFSDSFLSDILSRIEGDKIAKPGTAVVKDKELCKSYIELHDSLLKREDTMSLEESLIFVFSRTFTKSRDMRNPLSYGLNDDRRIAVIIDFFNENLHRQISLEELAILSDCTSFHIIRIFRSRTGMSPYAYLTQMRLERARRLLEAGFSITDTAFETGFSDQSHLTRKFKRRYGITPGIYMNQLLS